MEFGLVGLVELRIKAGSVRFRIGCLGCAFLVGEGQVLDAFRVRGASGQV